MSLSLAIIIEQLKVRVNTQINDMLQSFWLRQGAQGVTMCVRPFMSNLSRAVNLHLSRSEINKRAVNALREQSENSQSIKIRVNTVGA